MAGMSAPPVVHEVLREPGSPLDKQSRSVLEPQFGRDFSHVRVHTGAKAAQSAGAVNALAYTVGQKIVFGAGQFTPGSSQGRQLLAHELVHTIQQNGHPEASPAGLEIASPTSPLELEASRLSRDAGKVGFSIARASVMRQPAGSTTCNVRTPEDCPSYEDWLAQFANLPTFPARDTSETGTNPSGHDVIGEDPAARFGQRGTSDKPVPAVGSTRAERFIDHPTDAWVQDNLPAELRATAYQLGSDCADIAVILRHVWLFSHNRSETYNGWRVGVQAGETDRARQRRIGGVIRGPRSIVSANAASMINPYSDTSGRPIRSFRALQNLLHPGDILVWAHHRNGVNRPRTGGHVQTISAIQRTGGEIVNILLLQGNQPVGRRQAAEIQRADPSGPGAGTLRAAPGRRIETNSMRGSELEDTPVQSGRRQVEMVWTWNDSDHTILVAAGPPRAADRPAAGRERGRRVRRISDWFVPIRGSTAQTIPGIMEAALQELRALIEGGQDGLDNDAAELARRAGERIWSSARSGAQSSRGDRLAEESHFRPVTEIERMIGALGNPSIPARRGFPTEASPRAQEVSRVFQIILDTFTSTARGISSIDFTRRQPRGTTPFHTLVTGFDPFNSAGRVAPGTVNPSAAAALALDRTSLREGNTFISVEGVVLPVDFEVFRRGLVENAVRPLVQNRTVDAILTVSLDESIAPKDPVRLERYVVGVHSDNQGEAVPAGPGGGLGAAIIEAQAPPDGTTTPPIEAVAAEAEQRRTRRQPAVPRPDVGTNITFLFADATTADRALAALNQTPQGLPKVVIDDPTAIQQILRTMRREADGTSITFQAGRQSFRTRIVEGPGGDFLSNEVSYRVLRLLAEEGRTDLPSFHVHVPRALPAKQAVIPQDTSTRAGRRARSGAVSTAIATRDRIIAALRSLIRAVARRVTASRSSGGSQQP